MSTLSEYKQRHGLTTRDLADRLGLSKSYTNELVRGEKTPSLQRALGIQSATRGEVAIASLIKSPVPSGSETSCLSVSDAPAPAPVQEGKSA